MEQKCGNFLIPRTTLVKEATTASTGDDEVSDVGTDLGYLRLMQKAGEKQKKRKESDDNKHYSVLYVVIFSCVDKTEPNFKSK